MEKYSIKATKNSPFVLLDPNGFVKLQGRCIMDDAKDFFKPILTWIENFPGSKVLIEINLEYINTSSTKQIFSIFKLLKTHLNIKEVITNWYFEEGDKDGLDFGKDISKAFEFNFHYFEYSEIV